MNLHPDDPRLTDYLLGELPADEAAAVERALAEDPALRQAFEELFELRRLLTETLTPGTGSLLPAQRQAILRTAREVDQSGTGDASAPRRISWQRWRAPLAAAAAIALAAIGSMVMHHNWRHPSRAQVAAAKALVPAPADHHPHTLPAPGPADSGTSAKPPDNPVAATAGLANTSDFPALLTRGVVTATTCPILALPVRAGDASLGWITAALLTDHRLPSRDAVRLEEILNHFALRPNGPSVVARQPAGTWHPDDRSLGTSTHVATLASETMACPWQPSASFVLVSIRGNPFSDCDVKAVFRANPATVNRYRLLGFAPLAGQPQTPLPTRLPAQTRTLLVLEIQPAANIATPITTATDFGKIEWSVNGQAAESLALRPPDADQEPSADARFAALVCTFAQWLANDPATTIDQDMLAAIARQIAASPALPAERAAFLNLIERALKL